MTYTEALALIKSEFQTRYDSDCSEVIRTGLTYDGCNGLYVELYNLGDKVVLSDGGITKDIYFEHENEDECLALCEANGFEFNHWKIQRPFTNIQDVYDFIDFLLLVTNTYDPMEE